MVKLTLNTAASPFDVELTGNCLIAGRMGSGKTVLLHDIIRQLSSSGDIDLYVIDPKGYEHKDFCEDTNIKWYNAENCYEALAEVFTRTVKDNHKEQVIIIDEYQAIDESSFFSVLDQLLEMAEYGVHVIMSSQGVTPEIAFSISQFDLRIVFDCTDNVREKVFIDRTPICSFIGDHHYLVYRSSTNSVATCKQEGPKVCQITI